MPSDKRYLVTWVIDIDSPGVETYREAAQRAWEHMRREGSIANVFTVQQITDDGKPVGKPRTVDLIEGPLARKRK